MTVYRLSKIHSAFHSFLSPRFTPTPTCSTRPCLGSEEGELLVATRPRYLPFPRNGKEAVDVSRWREGRCSRIVLYFPQGGGVIRITEESPGIWKVSEKLVLWTGTVDPRVLHLCFLERLLLPPRETFRFREIIADGRGSGFLYRCMYDACVHEEGSLAMEKVPVLRSRYRWILLYSRANFLLVLGEESLLKLIG